MCSLKSVKMRNTKLYEFSCRSIKFSSRLVVVNFISGLLNSTNNKENNSKPERGHSDKTI